MMLIIIGKMEKVAWPGKAKGDMLLCHAVVEDFSRIRRSVDSGKRTVIESYPFLEWREFGPRRIY